ncbi:chitin deacetylase 8-like isoform X1 [Hydra vulgaris]|uniref:chitin deacetylase 8-like isoform X1 n=1 Tax=Hydra vulgaris TaxID=6087 RepID=UPI0032EA84E7
MIVKCDVPNCCKPWQSSCKKYFPQRFLPGPVVISHAAEGILIPEPNVARNNPKSYFSTLAQRLEYLMLYLMKEKLEMAKKLVLLLLVTHQMSANVIRRDTFTEFKIYKHDICNIYFTALLQPNSASENAFNQSSIVQAPLATTIGATNTMLLENVSTESFSVETAQSLFSSNEPMTTELFTASTQVDLMSTNLVLPESPESVSTCNVINCRLPSCRCAGTDIPGGLSKVNTPQMILLTMDDGVTPENYQLYSELLNGSTNFNGCPIKATFFVSGDNSDYAYVKKLQQSGHEIADHSATHKLPEEWWSNTAALEDLQTEILTQKNTIQQEVGTTTLGWRTPFLASQENTFKVLAENQFLYDSSLGTTPGTRWWPYTLDYLPSLPCYMANCPTFTYPGVWEIPLITLQCDESATTFATMLDECTNLETEESTYNMLMTNFKLHYEDNKQPFPMFGHSTWFDNASYRKDAVIRFMNDVRKFSDVYFVTAQQAIEWIKSPAGLDKKPFSCNQ